MRQRVIRLLAAAALSSAFLPATAGEIKAVVVAGATGGTGSQLVIRLLEKGYTVRAFVRDADRAREQLGDHLEYVEGDVKDPDSVAAAVAGMDALISAIGAGRGGDTPEAVDYQGVKNLTEAAAAADLQHFVLVSSRGATQKDHPLNKMFNNVLIWKLEGENALRASGVAYTIVRPGGLIDEPGGRGRLVFEQGDSPVGQMFIPRADLAAICVAALEHPESKFKTLETHRVDGEPDPDWAANFAALHDD
jgi:uncharacterized protein YbjT (DUF2867 family)